MGLGWSTSLLRPKLADEFLDAVAVKKRLRLVLDALVVEA